MQHESRCDYTWHYRPVHFFVFPAGELLTVQPWAAHLMPGLFVLNERVILSGHWEHGFFSLAAVGAYNVGSIQLDFDKVNNIMQMTRPTLYINCTTCIM